VSYLPIENHGVIGDLHTAALVGMDGTIDWLCLPNFDSPSLFASILDSRRGGHFRIAAAVEQARQKQMYLPDSNVLLTRTLTADGVGEIVDFMPVSAGGGPKEASDHRVIRLVRGVRGQIPFRLECRPAFDYAREKSRLERTPWGVRFSSSATSVDLATPLDCRLDGEAAVAELLVKEGDEIAVILAQADEAPPAPRERLGEICQEAFRSTLHFWQSWTSRHRYQGRWREAVKRSFLALKLLTYAPTGAIVAAATTSLPERIGGIRNWDYRYTWIRDAAFTVYAFLRVGFTEEAHQFVDFFAKRCELGPASGLQVLYGVDGRADVPEVCLDHLEGYRGSRPVRVGNDAARQFQLDLSGALMDAIYLYNKYVQPIGHELWLTVRQLADWVCDHWEEEDEGIWEVRGGRHQFTYSKLMCWVALDRAHRLATKRSLPGNRHRWLEQRDRIYETIMTRGFSEKLGSFVQSLDSEILDASLLIAPLVKFVSPSDPRMLGTIEAVQKHLESDHLVRRYDPAVAPDGIGTEEGTFSMCTFWLAEAQARAGRLEEARLTFEKMLGYANHLGLYSEQIGLTGESLGNFPQAFTHLGLISAAYNIDRALSGARQGWAPSAADPRRGK
jgi:GH15 family glucan-1,4-alpha-glucosidase